MLHDSALYKCTIDIDVDDDDEDDDRMSFPTCTAAVTLEASDRRKVCAWQDIAI